MLRSGRIADLAIKAKEKEEAEKLAAENDGPSPSPKSNTHVVSSRTKVSN